MEPSRTFIPSYVQINDDEDEQVGYSYEMDYRSYHPKSLTICMQIFGSVRVIPFKCVCWGREKCEIKIGGGGPRKIELRDPPCID